MSYCGKTFKQELALDYENQFCRGTNMFNLGRSGLQYKYRVFQGVLKLINNYGFVKDPVGKSGQMYQNSEMEQTCEQLLSGFCNRKETCDNGDI